MYLVMVCDKTIEEAFEEIHKLSNDEFFEDLGKFITDKPCPLASFMREVLIKSEESSKNG